ncbi:hypothetical protein F2Q68_00026605 [Brassica cretica]|uniref:methionine--tRNA ligase n=1 Tax=Brassica cretica TaxID=69181 RepID=A0A8S9ID53_BRACR|nr:hypothetical protein F2Q68_00026605 [Brassica cretica]
MKHSLFSCYHVPVCAFRYHAIHKEVYDWFDISFDKFGRTSTPEQTQVCQAIFKKLFENNFLSENTMQQLYCDTCQKFLADRLVEGSCPFPECNYDSARGDQCEKCGKLLNPTELKDPRCKVMFPSTQLGTGENWTLMKTISVTEYLNYETGKFSKSKGVGVFGNDVKDTNIPVEVWRYYLLTNRPEVSDTLFTWGDLQAKLTGELLNNLGNFVNRVLSFIAKPEPSGYGSVIPDAPGAESHPLTQSLAEKVGKFVKEYVEAMEKVKLKQGLKLAMTISNEGNAYLQEAQFWKLFKEDKPSCAIVIRTAAGLVYLLAQLLEPFMPSFSREVFKQLNLPLQFSLSDEGIASRLWEILPPGHRIGTPQPLFKELKDEEVQQYKDKFAGNQADRRARDVEAANMADQLKKTKLSDAKKQKASKGAGTSKPQPAATLEITMARLDIRVGKILKAEKHPNADSLYVEQIDVGGGEIRTVVSGLVKYIPLEEMQVCSNSISPISLIRKFSKSKGVGVFGNDVKDTNIPVEVWRYYLLTNRPEVSDTLFTWGDLQAKLTGELLNNLGNFVNRVLSFIAKPEPSGYGSVIPDAPGAESHPLTQSLAEKVGKFVKEYVEAMEKVKLKQGLKIAMTISNEGNAYLQEAQFWKLFKEDKPSCAIVIRTAAGLVYLLAQLLEPFMPSFSREVFKQLNLPLQFSLSDEGIASRLWEILPPGHRIGTPQPLFKELKDEEVQQYKDKFAGNQADRRARDVEAANMAEQLKKTKLSDAKKQKASKGAGTSKPQPAATLEITMARLDIRVGKILKAEKHPNADSLYVEQIDVGGGEIRTVVSGLVKYIRLEEMQNRMVCVLCNLKPSKMRDIMSQAMVLAASSSDGSKVELVEPPESATIGERVRFAGHEGEPDVVLNPKKKVWETLLVDLNTNENLVACYKDIPFTTDAGVCKVSSISNGTIR